MLSKECYTFIVYTNVDCGDICAQRAHFLMTCAQKCGVCCGYVVVVVDCRVQINGGRIVDVVRTMVGMVSILEC